jgi:hypothetical protein
MYCKEYKILQTLDIPLKISFAPCLFFMGSWVRNCSILFLACAMYLYNKG